MRAARQPFRSTGMSWGQRAEAGRHAVEGWSAARTPSISAAPAIARAEAPSAARTAATHDLVRELPVGQHVTGVKRARAGSPGRRSASPVAPSVSQAASSRFPGLEGLPPVGGPGRPARPTHDHADDAPPPPAATMVPMTPRPRPVARAGGSRSSGVTSWPTTSDVTKRAATGERSVGGVVEVLTARPRRPHFAVLDPHRPCRQHGVGWVKPRAARLGQRHLSSGSIQAGAVTEADPRTALGSVRGRVRPGLPCLTTSGTVMSPDRRVV